MTLAELAARNQAGTIVSFPLHGFLHGVLIFSPLLLFLAMEHGQLYLHFGDKFQAQLRMDHPGERTQ
jgi:hypothetical protein